MSKKYKVNQAVHKISTSIMLPDRLLYHIIEFNTRINYVKINVLNDLPYKFDKILEVVILICKKFNNHYANIMKLFKLNHYLCEYADKYYDVLLLQRILNVHHPINAIPTKEIKYYCNEELGYDDDHFITSGCYATESWNKDKENVPITFLEEKESNVKYKEVNVKLGGIDVDKTTKWLTKGHGQIILYIDRYIGGHNITRLFIDPITLPLLDYNNIEIYGQMTFIEIITQLTEDKFKKLVNEKEGKIIFSDVRN